MEFQVQEEMQASAGDRLYQTDLENARSGQERWSNREWLERIDQEHIRTEMPMTLANSRFLLGFETLNYTKQTALIDELSIMKSEGGNIRTDPKVLLFLGGRGDGKTILAKNIVLGHLKATYNPDIVTIDASRTPEHFYSRWAVTSRKIPKPQGPMSEWHARKLLNFFAQFNIKPRGFSNVVYKPMFNTAFREEGIDKEYKLKWLDFSVNGGGLAKFDFTDGRQSVLDVIDLADSRPAAHIVGQALTNDRIVTFDDIIHALKTKTLNPDRFTEGKPITSSTFISYLEGAITEGVLTDEPQPEITMLYDLVTHDFLCLRHKLRTSNSDPKSMVKFNIFLKVAMGKVINDRLMAVSGTKEERVKAYQKKAAGTLFLIEEADSVMPNSDDNYTTKITESLASKDRKLAISTAAIVQDVSKLNQGYAGQVDIIYTSLLEITKNANYLSQQGVSDKWIARLSNPKLMPRQVTNSLGFKTSRFAKIDTHTGKITLFYPPPPVMAYKII